MINRDREIYATSYWRFAKTATRKQYPFSKFSFKGVPEWRGQQLVSDILTYHWDIDAYGRWQKRAQIVYRSSSEEIQNVYNYSNETRHSYENNLDVQTVVVGTSGFSEPTVSNNRSKIDHWVVQATVDDVLALPEVTTSTKQNKLKEFTIHPMSTRDILRLNDVDLKLYDVFIVDSIGNLVDADDFKVNNNLIDVSDLVEGTYQLILINENEVVGKNKFVKL